MRDQKGVSPYAPTRGFNLYAGCGCQNRCCNPGRTLGTCWECLLDEEEQYGLSTVHRARPEGLRRGTGDQKGTRVTVRTVLASLAEGAKTEEILEDFPTLKEEDIRAVIAFAAASAEKDMPVQSVPDIQ